MVQQLRVLAACVRLGALHRFAYRLEIATSLISSLIVVVLNASIWGAVVEGREQLAGMTPLQVSTYVIVAWTVTTVSATRLDEVLGNRFRSGQIAADLLRPLDLQAYLTARDAGRALTALGVTAVPVVVLTSTVFPLAWPTRLWSWLFVAVSVALAVLIGAQIAFLVGIASFRLKNISGLAHLKATTTAVLSGAVVPLDAMPDVIRGVILALPFQGMSHAPASLFLERVPWTEALGILGVQAAWVAGLWVLCRLAWRWALHHLTVQGG